MTVELEGWSIGMCDFMDYTGSIILWIFFLKIMCILLSRVLCKKIETTKLLIFNVKYLLWFSETLTSHSNQQIKQEDLWLSRIRSFHRPPTALQWFKHRKVCGFLQFYFICICQSQNYAIAIYECELNVNCHLSSVFYTVYLIVSVSSKCLNIRST